MHEFIDSRDGRKYKTVTIGSQVWMAENLAFLPMVSPRLDGSWEDPYYYVYGYEGNNVDEAKATLNFKTYGVLYNWQSAVIAYPDGWHLPTFKEWVTLEEYLINSEYAYSLEAFSTWRNKIAKAMTTNHGWKKTSSEGSVGNNDFPEKQNACGFSALPGGSRSLHGSFTGIGESANWWSNNEANTHSAYYTIIHYYGVHLTINVTDSKAAGFSIRCVKD